MRAQLYGADWLLNHGVKLETKRIEFQDARDISL
jgi:hypothetical protein